jgi:stage V sporulation protein AF
MQYVSVGSESKTDVVLCYMADRADEAYVKKLKERLSSLEVAALTMGHQSLAESLIKTRWYNPFPKIRITERPDVAASQIYEGSVILLIDTSPQAMILPTSIFDFLQETNDFYFPPLTGSYVRAVRHIIFWLTLFLIPVWYLLTKYPEQTPRFLEFALPKEAGLVPILAQLLIVEFVVDGLKMASMNTPDMLSNSLSVVGGLILGDFAVGLGWLIPEVIILTAFVAIANFSQRSYELGYAFKFLRIMLLILSGLFGIWGFIIGIALIITLLATNKTINGECKYLYPLIPFNGKALMTVLFRVRKKD